MFKISEKGWAAALYFFKKNPKSSLVKDGETFKKGCSLFSDS
jgi:hypothetical protein